MPAIFPSREELQATLGPIVGDAAEQLGSRCRVYRTAGTRAADGSTARAPVMFADNVAIRLRMLTREAAEEVFGRDTDTRMSGSARRGAAVKVGHLIKVLSGGFVGEKFQVKESVENDLSDSLTIGLVECDGVLV